MTKLDDLVYLASIMISVIFGAREEICARKEYKTTCTSRGSLVKKNTPES